MRRYTKHSLSEIRGPVTVISGKKRRLTFVECNNDLNSMIDVGKVADLVLLMIDGSFGFEMARMNTPYELISADSAIGNIRVHQRSPSARLP